MNVAAYRALRQAETLNYVGPIDPPPLLWQKLLSKLLRVAGGRRDFYFYSPKRLDAIASAVSRACIVDARLDFFHGFTPWILTRPARPYIAWSDCAFHDYIDVYHDRDLFRRGDLDRIEKAEAEWLRNARHVVFTNSWAAQRTTKYYGLDYARVHSVGIFGEVEMPDADAYSGGRQFVFISTDFEAKGGAVVLGAFRRLRQRHPDATLVVIGALPKGGLHEPNVIGTGFLKKEDIAQQKRFHAILAGARALVHPTGSDISPLIIVEAGYLGCPAIASRRFAIPELIEHGVSGLLIDDPSDVGAVAAAMSWMLEHNGDYGRMRQCAWSRAHGQHSKAAFEGRLQALVRAVQ